MVEKYVWYPDEKKFIEQYLKSMIKRMLER